MEEKLYVEVRIDQIPQEFANTFKKRDGSTGTSIKFCIGKLKQADNYGNTHYVKIVPPKNYTGQAPNDGFVGRGRVYTFDNKPQGTTQTANDDVPM